MKQVRLLMILLALVLVPGINSVIQAQQTGPVIIAPPVKPPDKDGDGLLDADDQCPSKAGPRTNGGCPEGDSSSGGGSQGSGDSQPSEDPNRDSDGDGLSDKDDQCPKQGGHADNGGCPPDSSPNPDITPEPPTFRPPALPVDGCFVTPKDDFKVNVRIEPDVAAAILGNLIPGKVYAADGYVMKGADVWFVLDTYEGSTGTSGYSASSVLLWSTCALIEALPDDETLPPTFDPAGDFESPDGGSPILCHITVGFDAPTWSSNPDMSSINYGAFWFESAPGAPLSAGTKAWGVVFLADFISLPDYVNIFAIAPDAALFEKAMNSPYGGTYNWPTMEGGIQSGDVKLYRLTSNNSNNACGSVVDIDDFTSLPTNNDPSLPQVFEPVVIDDLACTMSLGNWLFAYGYEPGEAVPVGSNPIAILNGDMVLAGDIHNWYTGLKADGMGELVQIMDYPGWAMLPRTGGNCGPITGRDIVRDKSVSPNQNGGMLVALGDGSVRFVRGSVSPLNECPEGWIHDIYDTDVSDIFYCRPTRLSNQGNNPSNSLPPFTPIECPADWVADIYDTDVNDIFYCRPNSLTSDSPRVQRGLGLECPEGWIHDIYDTAVSDLFYCRPDSLTDGGQSEIQDDVIVDGKIITAENFNGFGIECPTGWIHDIYDTEVSDTFYCRPKALASRS